MSADKHVPRVLPSPREEIHRTFCAVQFECRFDAGVKQRNASIWCKGLDAMLDFNDETLLHAKARALDDDFNRMDSRASRVLGPGLLHAVRQIDPFEKYDEDGVADMTSPLFGENDEHPDCPACIAGRVHHHRKSDGSPVKAYVPPEEG